jgi:hypothetical protein
MDLKQGAMVNSPFSRYVLSPLLVALFLVGIELASRHGWFTASLALPVGVLALCLFWSGLKANILSAIFITVHALYTSSFEPSRTLQLVFTVWPVAILGGILRRWLIESVRETERQRLRAAENQSKADFVDNLNGNIETIKEINRGLIELANAMPVLSRPAILEILNRIQNKAANLAQRTVGWHQLALAKKEVVGDES